MDDKQLRALFHEMTLSLEDKIDRRVYRIEEQMRSNMSISLEAHEKTRREFGVLSGEVKELGGRVEQLEKTVHGSDPPEGGEGPVPVPPGGLSRAHSQQDMEIASVQGQLIALSSTVNEVKTDLEEIKQLNQQQTKAMGLKPKDDERSFGHRVLDFGGWLVREREGQKFLASTLAAVTGLVTALGTTYALMTGRLPLPVSPVPPPPVVYETPGQ